jgi:RNA-directed DNA polymerase
LKVSYIEGLAIRSGPESCVGDREVEGEALTGERAGWVLSREIHAPPRGGILRGADVLEKNGRPHSGRRFGKTPRDPARSQTPGMYGCTSFGNREIPFLSVAAGCADRIGKSQDVRR